MPTDSPEYLQKKKKLEKILTIYGRNPVVEALEDKSLQMVKIHLANSNQNSDVIRKIMKLCESRNIPILYHTREELSRISKNGKQDQGVAADILLPSLQDFTLLKSTPLKYGKIIALDHITNPQNIGMIIRSVCAGYADGVLIPKQGCSAINALVIKASAGAVFKASIYRCDHLDSTLLELQKIGFSIASLDVNAPQSIFEYHPQKPTIYVLGNEADGVSKKISEISDVKLSIPMNNQVESLNVSITAALIAFQQFEKTKRK